MDITWFQLTNTLSWQTVSTTFISWDRVKWAEGDMNTRLSSDWLRCRTWDFLPKTVVYMTTCFFSLTVLNLVFNILKKENNMVAISCTVLIEECPSPFEDSLTVFALQVRLLEDENLWCLVTPFPHPCWWFCSKESKRSIGNALCSLAHSAARLADCYSQACSILPFSAPQPRRFLLF